MALGEKIRKLFWQSVTLSVLSFSFLMATIRHLNADYFSIHLNFFDYFYRVVGGFLYRPSL